MGVELDTVALLVPPAVLLLGVVEVQVAGELLPKAERRAPFRLVFSLAEEGLLNDVSWTPGIRHVYKLELHRLKAVLPPCMWQSQLKVEMYYYLFRTHHTVYLCLRVEHFSVEFYQHIKKALQWFSQAHEDKRPICI